MTHHKFKITSLLYRSLFGLEDYLFAGEKTPAKASKEIYSFNTSYQ
jgi:hypothetical protein